MSLTCFVQQHVELKRECPRLPQLLASTVWLYRFPWPVIDCQVECVTVLRACSLNPKSDSTLNSSRTLEHCRMARVFVCFYLYFISRVPPLQSV